MALRKKKTDSAEQDTTGAGIVVMPGNQTTPQPAEPPVQPKTMAEPATTPQVQPTSSSDDGGVSWTASEFIAHQKSAGWYLTLAGVALVVAALIYVLTRDKISTAVVLIGAFTLGFYGSRKPRQLGYRLDNDGVTIGTRYHSYEEFRSFAIVPEGAFSSIVFMPLKRFAPLTTIYYGPADEDKIVQLLTNILPFEEYRHDVVDQLMRRIRF